MSALQLAFAALLLLASLHAVAGVASPSSESKSAVSEVSGIESILPGYERPSQSPHVQHSAEEVAHDQHISHFPSVQIHHRSAKEKSAEEARDAATLHALQQQHWVDRDTEPILAEQSQQQQHRGRQFDDETLEFFETASSTLSRVLNHDSERIYHYKSLLARGKSHLRRQEFDAAATLFQEASHLYFEAVKAPYAKIATSKALGDTIEKRIESQMEAERVAADAAGGGAATVNTAAAQFRQKEMENRPHVHNALKEYHASLQKSLANEKNKKKKAASPSQQ